MVICIFAIFGFIGNESLRVDLKIYIYIILLIINNIIYSVGPFYSVLDLKEKEKNLLKSFNYAFRRSERQFILIVLRILRFL